MSELKNKLAIAALASIGMAVGGAAHAGTYDVVGSSAAAVNTGVLRVASTSTVSVIASGIASSISGAFSGGFTSFGSRPIPASAMLHSGNSGFSAGGSSQRLSVWAQAAYNHINFDDSLLPYKGHFTNGGVGADYLFRHNLIGGVSLGYENDDITTTFNNGTLKTDGYTVAPYVALRINRFLVATLTGGYTWLSTDMTRTGGAVTGSYNGHRLFGAASLIGTYWMNRWMVGGSLGYLYSRESDDSYTESAGSTVGSHTASIGQGRAGVKLGYSLGSIMPYVTGRVEHDFTSPGDAIINGQSVGTGKTGYVIGGGLAFGSGNITGGIEATSTEGRDHLTQYGVTGTVRVSF